MGDECTRCHAKTEMREFHPDTYSNEGYIQVARFNNHYYAMGLNPVEEGLEAIEVASPEDGFLKIDASKLAVINRDARYSLVGEPNATLRIYQNKLQTIYFDAENNLFLDGINNGWGYIDNDFRDEMSDTWDEEEFKYVQAYGNFWGQDCTDGERYEIILKTTNSGTPYFGLQPKTWDEKSDLFIYYMQCKHENLVHTPGTEATCMEPSTLESYYCDDCESYFSDAKCHHEISVREYLPNPGKGHHYEAGSDVCTNCGEHAAIYRPVTSETQFNAGYRYLMVGHVGDQYYVLSRPTLQTLRRPWDDDMSDDELPKEYQWNKKKLMATPVTLNADGSITANGNNMLEFSLTCIRNNYSEIDAVAGSPFFFRTPWGIITDETNYDDGMIMATFNEYAFENWKYITYGDETVPRRLRLAQPDFKFFDWMDDEEREAMLPENIRNAKVEENSVLMHRVWAGDQEEHGTYFLVKEEGYIYFCPFNHFWSEWATYEHPTAEIMVPTLYYCTSKPMPHIDHTTSEATIYADELTPENLETALDELTDDEGIMVTNIDLSEVKDINLTAADIRDKVFANEAVSNNALVILPSNSTITGTNIVVNGTAQNIQITDGNPFVVPAQYSTSDNLIKTAQASYERAMNGSSLWGTLYLPFVIKSTPDVQLFKLSEVTIDGEDGVLSFEPVDEVAESTPCVFRRNTTSDGVAFTTSSVAIHPAGAALSTSVEAWSINGTLEGCNIQTNAYDKETGDYDDITRYYIAANQFWQAEVETYVPAFRAWFEQQTTANSARTLRIFVTENEQTSILEVKADGNLVELDRNAMYDLRGHRVTKVEHGTYIIGGKKVVIK